MKENGNYTWSLMIITYQWLRVSVYRKIFNYFMYALRQILKIKTLRLHLGVVAN